MLNFFVLLFEIYAYNIYSEEGLMKMVENVLCLNKMLSVIKVIKVIAIKVIKVIAIKVIKVIKVIAIKVIKVIAIGLNKTISLQNNKNTKNVFKMFGKCMTFSELKSFSGGR